jgi:pimeloyl-ACP methyl ester carboxylesterase
MFPGLSPSHPPLRGSLDDCPSADRSHRPGRAPPFDEQLPMRSRGTAGESAVTLSTTAFAEAYVEVDGFRIRYLEGGAGTGAPLVWLHSAGGLRLSRAHELLAARYRLIALEVPGFGAAAANERSKTYAELGATLLAAIRQLGHERVKLWGTSFGSVVAVWLAVGAPEAIEALVLEAPAAILPEGGIPAPSSPEDLWRTLFAHPERQPPMPALEPALRAQRRALLARLPHPCAAETEAALGQLNVPTLVVCGTQDTLIPAAMGRVYRERMPNCNYVLVYDAGHEIATERPVAFASLVVDFLDRREAFIVNAKSSLQNP